MVQLKEVHATSSVADCTRFVFLFAAHQVHACTCACTQYVYRAQGSTRRVAFLSSSHYFCKIKKNAFCSKYLSHVISKVTALFLHHTFRGHVNDGTILAKVHLASVYRFDVWKGILFKQASPHFNLGTLCTCRSYISISYMALLPFDVKFFSKSRQKFTAWKNTDK